MQKLKFRKFLNLKKNILLFVKKQYYYNYFKFIIKNKFFNKQLKIFFLYYYSIWIFYSFTIQKNICFKTYYSKSINTFLKLNRMQASEYLSKLVLPGIHLLNW